MNLGGQNCPAAPFYCSWNRASGGSWATNQNEVAEQVFYYVNHYHDHLRDDAEIDFSAAKGAFESSDPLQAEVDDGANGSGGAAQRRRTSTTRT